MSTQFEDLLTEDAYLQKRAPLLIERTLAQLRHVLRFFFFFNICFCGLLIVESILFFSLLPFLYHSTILAVFLSALFLTVFSYFVLLLYFQASKTEQYERLKKEFLLSCKREGSHHLSVAAALMALLAQFEEKKWLKICSYPKILRTLFSRSIRNDLFRFQQLMLRAALKEQIDQVKLTPTDLEVHLSLANNYIKLSELHVPFDKEFSRQATRLAIEEFQILNDYAPNDPWIHEQLAKGYRALSMVKEELHEMELLITLRTQDENLLHRLGCLYFEQGLNAKGLRIYETLMQINLQKAAEVVSLYGSSQRL